MSSKRVNMTLGEVQDLLRNLRRVKQFYARQVTSINTSIREHDKIAKKLQSEKYTHNVHFTTTDDEDAADAADEYEEHQYEPENISPEKKTNEKRKKILDSNMQDYDAPSSDSEIREHKKLKRNNKIQIKVKQKKCYKNKAE